MVRKGKWRDHHSGSRHGCWLMCRTHQTTGGRSKDTGLNQGQGFCRTGVVVLAGFKQRRDVRTEREQKGASVGGVAEREETTQPVNHPIVQAAAPSDVSKLKAVRFSLLGILTYSSTDIGSG